MNRTNFEHAVYALKLTHIPATHIDKAWHEGAHQLGEACKYSGGEITADQLKMILSRGERSLIRMDDQTGVVGWGVIWVSFSITYAQPPFCVNVFAPIFSNDVNDPLLCLGIMVLPFPNLWNSVRLHCRL